MMEIFFDMKIFQKKMKYDLCMKVVVLKLT